MSRSPVAPAGPRLKKKLKSAMLSAPTVTKSAPTLGGVLGRRVGTKRRDMRWQTPDGAMWDSKFEAQVYESIYRSGQCEIRRTVKGRPEGDTFVYSLPVRNATCDSCESTEISQRREFTPDLYSAYAYRGNERTYSHAGFYIESKGYIRADQRALLRAFCKARPDIDVRFVLQRDWKLGSGTAASWIEKYLKRPVCVWKGRLPEEWLHG